MLDQLHPRLPHVRALVASAEHISLQDSSADAVLVAQAGQWVDPEEAVPEVARILGPGGRIGLLWKHWDERVDRVAAFGRLISQVGSQHARQLTRPDATVGLGAGRTARPPGISAPTGHAESNLRSTLNLGR